MPGDAEAGYVRENTAIGMGLRWCGSEGVSCLPLGRALLRRWAETMGETPFLPDRLAAKLKRFWKFKAKRGEELEPTDPLFCNQSRKRISKRRVQFAWREWQHRAGFDRLYPFHCIRHSAVTNVYRMTRDLFLAQRFARHVSPLTTTRYTHPSDEELASGLRHLTC